MPETWENLAHHLSFIPKIDRWNTLAACKDADPEIFFPVGRGGHQPKDLVDSLWFKYCGECPVKQRCMDHALENEEYGFWAGTTQEERKVARQEGRTITFDEVRRNRGDAGN